MLRNTDLKSVKLKMCGENKQFYVAPLEHVLRTPHAPEGQDRSGPAPGPLLPIAVPYLVAPAQP